MPTAPGIARAVRRTDYLRRALPWGGRKEWLHFCVRSGSVDLLVNFSVMDLEAGGEVGRLVLIAHDGRSWFGDVETFAAPRIVAPGGGMDFVLGENSVRWYDDAFHVYATVAGLAVDLRLRPRTHPVFIPNFPLAQGMPVHWLLLPRLQASGSVELNGDRHRWVDASAYHDHNWGRFAWGQDFSWEWGYALPDDPDDPWSAVIVRFTDRARTHTQVQSLLLWEGTELVRLLRDTSLTIRRNGLRRPPSPPRFPALMALLSPGTATDVPARYDVVADDRGDHVELSYTPEAVSQIVVPNDRDLGLTHINETLGPVTMTGTVGGRSLRFRGRGVFEFLHA